MKPTTLVYSSHNRCSYLHKEWIVERALQSHHNKTILYLPMSMGEQHQQEYSWGTFRWYFDQFRQYGLHAVPFFWNDNLTKEDVDILFKNLSEFEVVILGGGSSSLGLQRYKTLGEWFYGDRELFSRILHERQSQGKLTVGFSAGADQLSQYLVSCVDYELPDPYGFGLAKNIMVTLHHEWGREGMIYNAARMFPDCLVFGLPNDAGIAVEQGYLPSGNFWQIIEFIVDCSWDLPEDGFHIKTRQGMNIEHFYNNGKHWTFNGGDQMLRIVSPDGHYQNGWIFQQGTIKEYWSQNYSHYNSMEEIFAAHS